MVGALEVQNTKATHPSGHNQTRRRAFLRYLSKAVIARMVQGRLTAHSPVFVHVYVYEWARGQWAVFVSSSLSHTHTQIESRGQIIGWNPNVDLVRSTVVSFSDVSSIHSFIILAKCLFSPFNPLCARSRRLDRAVGWKITASRALAVGNVLSRIDTTNERHAVVDILQQVDPGWCQNSASRGGDIRIPGIALLERGALHT